MSGGINLVTERLNDKKSVIAEKVAAGEKIDFKHWTDLLTGYAHAQNAQLRARCDQKTEEYSRAVAEVERVRDEVLQYYESMREQHPIHLHVSSDS